MCITLVSVALSLSLSQELTHQDDIAQDIFSKAKITKHSNYFIDKGSGANRRKDDFDDGSLTIILQFVMHREDLIIEVSKHKQINKLGAALTF